MASSKVDIEELRPQRDGGQAGRDGSRRAHAMGAFDLGTQLPQHLGRIGMSTGPRRSGEAPSPTGATGREGDRAQRWALVSALRVRWTPMPSLASAVRAAWYRPTGRHHDRCARRGRRCSSASRDSDMAAWRDPRSSQEMITRRSSAGTRRRSRGRSHRSPWRRYRTLRTAGRREVEAGGLASSPPWRSHGRNVEWGSIVSGVAWPCSMIFMLTKVSCCDRWRGRRSRAVGRSRRVRRRLVRSAPSIRPGAATSVNALASGR